LEGLRLDQCDQAICWTKSGMSGLSSACLWRIEVGFQLVVFQLGHYWTREGWACS
jgi:hypothetical protein